MYRVILIDDHPLVAAAVRVALEGAGEFEIMAEHNNGVAGLAAVRAHAPDLVIIDLNLPMLGGIDVIQRIRFDSLSAGILVLSGMEDSTVAVRALQAGANGFVHKSGQLKDLLTAARLVVQGLSYFSREVLDQAASTSAGADTNPSSMLSSKEYEVFRLLAKGLTNREIADQLLISNKTVSAYKTKAMLKLGVRNIRDLIEFARRVGLE